MIFALKIIVGAIAAIVGYMLGRRILDSVGLESHFQSRIWHYTVSQFGELLLVVLVISFVLLAGLLFPIIQMALEGAF